MESKAKRVTFEDKGGDPDIDEDEHSDNSDEHSEHLTEKPKFDMNLFDKYMNFRHVPKTDEDDHQNTAETMDKLHRRFSRGSTMHRHMPTR